jgi:hypothetical protein
MYMKGKCRVSEVLIYALMHNHNHNTGYVYYVLDSCGIVTSFPSYSTGARLIEANTLRQHRDKFTDNGLRKLTKHSLNLGTHGGSHYKRESSVQV